MVSVDLTQLDIAVRARHLANPEGEIGLAIASSLNSMNAVHRGIRKMQNGESYQAEYLMTLASSTPDRLRSPRGPL
jgi:hypothetical protein